MKRLRSVVGLGSIVCAAACVAVLAGCATGSGSSGTAETRPPFVRSPIEGSFAPDSLAALAAPHGLRIGVAVMPNYLDVPMYTEVLDREFSSLTPENHLKWETLSKVPGVWDFAGADKIVAYADSHGMVTRGHTLVWHYYPPFLRGTSPAPAEVSRLLREHITAVATHTKGRVSAWDVVNEPVDDQGNWRETVFYTAMGKQYLEDVLRWTRAADPDVPLFINDYNVEAINDKSNALYAMLKDLLARGAPLDGVGFQFHLDLDNLPDPGSVYANIKRFADLGLRIHFTELDIRIPTPVSSAKLERQAKAYADVFRLALAHPAVESVTFWNLNDGTSWVPDTFPGMGDAHLWDQNLQPKPALAAVKEVLRAGPPDESWIDQISSRTSVDRVVRPFVAIYAAREPVVDGVVAAGEWDGARTYPFAYNQLSGRDLRPPVKTDIDASWSVMVKGNRIYGLVRRADDVTITDLSSEYMNDCVEVFLLYGGSYVQLRSVVGKVWSPGRFTGGLAGVWNTEGTVFEFSIDVPDVTVEGSNIGWLIALADSDTKPVNEREGQYYPLPGNNTAWQGRGIGELIGLKPDGSNAASSIAGTPVAFSVLTAQTAPVADNTAGDSEWQDAPAMPFAFVHGASGPDQNARSSGLEFDTTQSWWKLLRQESRVFVLVAPPRLPVDSGYRIVELRVAYAGPNGPVEVSAPYAGGTIQELAFELPAALADSGKVQLDIGIELRDAGGRTLVLRPWADDGVNARWGLFQLL